MQNYYQVINSPLFQVLKAQCGGHDTFECFVKKKLTAVSGTISNDDLGMDSDLADELASKVDVIVNAAATTAFDER
jgi:thioester reductase-like protein